jgi:hypothetical protein
MSYSTSRWILGNKINMGTLIYKPYVRWGSATWRWKDFEEGYKFGSDLVPIGGQGKKL